MPHRWVNIKNATKGGHRPFPDFRRDLDAALDEFERNNQLSVDREVHSVVGFRGEEEQAEHPTNYSHPIPRIEDHGDYLFGHLAVPADTWLGERDFTSLLFLATEKDLITIIKDPPHTYSREFGTVFLNRYQTHRNTGSEKVGDTLQAIAKYVVDVNQFVLRGLEIRARRTIARIDAWAASPLSRSDALPVMVPELVSLEVEVRTMGSLTRETVDVARTIVTARGAPGVSQTERVFKCVKAATSQALLARARQVDDVRRDIQFSLDSALRRCDQIQEQSLIVATHRVTAFGALILVPNLLFDFFGQAFIELPSWIQKWGWWMTAGVTFAYWAIQYVILRRRRYL
jgi:Mg2+ and Co2+ transporter CorA